MKVRSAVGLCSAVALSVFGAGAMIIAGSSAVGAAEVSPTTSADDGSTGSLRYLLENLADSTTTVVLPAGSGPYVLGCAQGADVFIADDVVIIGNGNTVEQTCADARVFTTNSALTLESIVLTGATSDGDGGAIWNDDSADTLTIRGSTITGNLASGDGGGVWWAGTTTISDSTFTGNVATDDGAAISNGDSGGGSGSVTVVRSTIANNCAQDDGGAMDLDGPATIVNSTISNNTFDDQGAIAMDDGLLTIVYSTIASNTLEDDVACPGVAAGVVTIDGEVDAADTEEASNIQVSSGGMQVFGSVIALPIDVNAGSPGAFNCSLDGTVTSSGYNYSDDDTCDLGTATDQQNAGDPLLGDLASNGGPTQTRLPLAGSPLIDAIPIGACGDGDALAGEAVTSDQRGVARPQEAGCEIGAVELEPSLVITFTG